MKIGIVGATGAIGNLSVRKAIAAGHEVMAYVRSPEKLAVTDPHLRVVVGDLFDAARLTAALAGQDAVLSAFGRRVEAEKPVNAAFARVLVDSMESAGVRRLVYLSVGYLFTNSLPANLARNLFFQRDAGDHTEAERIVSASSIAWTIARPPQFTDSHRREYRVRRDGLPPFGLSIDREALADFLVSEVADSSYIRGIVGVAN